MPESTIDPPVKEPPVPQTPTRPNTPQPTEPEPPEPETEEASALTFGQRLNAAAQSLRGRGTSAEIEQLRGQVSAMSIERDTLRAELATAKARIKQTSAEREAARKALAEAEAAVTEFEKKVIDHSIDMVAEAHVPVSQLPLAAGSGESAPQTQAQVEQALAAIEPDRPGHEGEASQKRHEILAAWRNRNRK